MEDGLRAGLFSINRLNSIPFLSRFIRKHLKNIKIFRREIIVNQIVRELINLMVVDVINTTKRNLKKYKPKTILDVYEQDRLMVEFSNKMKEHIVELKEFLKINMYNHKKVVINTNRGKRIISDLFKYLIINHKKYINRDLFSEEQKERIIADFIAGMTDRYAIKLHRKIK